MALNDKLTKSILNIENLNTEIRSLKKENEEYKTKVQRLSS
jgi:cell shape-determining protein MreC